jgi:histidine triad (HIT) family protein
MSSKDCIFCKIIAGQIFAEKIWENDFAIAFLDIAPVSDCHTLIVPRNHYETLDQCPADYLAKVLSEAGKIAKAVTAAAGVSDYNLLCNNGRAAGQLVDHLHFHIIPRSPEDGILKGWPSREYPEGRAKKIAKKIRKNLKT